MEQITQFTSKNLWKRRAQSFILFPHLRFMFAVVTGFTALNLGVGILAGHRNTPSPNPFAAFADVFPGQPWSAVTPRGFTCPMQAISGVIEETCTFWPESGVLSKVTLVVSEGVVRHIAFMVRENTIRVGDLITLWGKPEISQYGHTTYFSWQNTGSITWIATDNVQFSLFLPVRGVSITDTNVPTAPNEGN